MRNLGLIVALWLAVLLPTNSFALGLGEIEVNSFLNQPLNAEIQVISARPGEIDDLLVSLASREAFTRAGLARTRNLSELRFAVKKNEAGDQAVIHVTTRGSVKEPFLNFLIEADWSKGRVLREFTILLDPPFYAEQPAAAETVSPPVEQPVAEEAGVSEIEDQSGVTPIVESSAPAEINETITEPIALTEDTQAEDTQPEPASDAYVAAETQNIIEADVLIVKDDTLWSIASAHKGQAHSMSQVMLAFQRANPDAFNDGNINNMKVGAVLRAPSAEELNAIGQQEAYAEVLVQNGLWDEYVARVTGVSPALASEAGGVEMATPEATAETGGELSLLLPAEEESESTGTGDSGEVDTLRTRLAIAEEELDASRIENQELESRIADLQARLSKVEELQKMVEIEDDSLAQMQADQAQQTDQTEAAGVMQQATADSVTEAIEASEEALLEELLAEEAAAQADEQAVIDDTASEAALADDALAETAGTDGMMAEEAETEATVPPPAPVIVAPPVTRAPSIFDGILPPDIIDMIPSMSGILGDPIILGAVGGFVVLLIVLVVLKRRKSSSDDESGINASSDDDLFAEDDDDELTPINLPESDTEGVTEAIEAEEIDSNIPDVEEFLPVEAAAEPAEDIAATEIFSAVEMPEPESTASAAAAEQDDVLNEVDVYLAYGLYDNAEDLLNSSLTENPDRADYRAKLLDTYFATKNGEAFSKEADKLKAMGDAAGNYWDRVQIMGYELAPDNPLFSDAKDSGLSAADLEIVKPQEADFDIGASDDDDNTSFSTTDFNLGEDDTGGDLDAAAEEIPQLDKLPSLDGDDGSAETEFDAAAGLPDDVGEELEFSIDDDAGDSDDADLELADDLEAGPSVDDETVATDDVELDDIALEFNIDGDEAAEVEDISEVNFDAGLDAEDSLKIEEEVDNFIDTAVVSPGADDKDKEDDDLDFGMEDSATDDMHSEEVSSAAAELNLDAEIIPLPVSNDDDISIIDFGGEDFVEPTDVVESIDVADDPTAMDFSIDDDDDEVSTGTFAPGDFDEPTAAVDSIADIDDIGDLMLPDDVDEVSTKLDLARAFIDMGDTEGARGSLEEVMSEGNDEQKAEAEALLEQI